MHLLTSVLLLLVVARLFGELVLRVGQPRIVGEILAGVVLGPALLGVVVPSAGLEGISELSIFLIVLSAGLEMEFKEVITSFRGRGTIASGLAFLLPFAAGVVLGFVFGFDALRSIFLGLCMSVTALPVAVRILASFNLLNSPIATYSIAAAITNDVLALLLLGVLLKFPAGGEGLGSEAFFTVLQSLVVSALKVSVFAAIVVVVSRLLIWGGKQTGYIEKWLEQVMEFFGREALFGIAVLFVLIFGTISEGLGTHFVIGTFFGGLLLSKDVFGTNLFGELEHTLNSIAGGFLAPIFFAYLGLLFDLHGLTNVGLVTSVLFVAVFSKILAGLLGGRIMGLSTRDSWGLGIILNGRGIMELVVANIALQRGFIGKDLFSILVLMGILTTVLTPVLFRRVAR